MSVSKTTVTILAAVFLLVTGAAVISRALVRGENHDEQQFLAPAMVVAGTGQVPYRDFPLLHMPGTILVYAAAAALSDHKILAMRLVCGLAALLLVLLIFVAGTRAAAGRGAGSRLLWACAGVLLLGGSPLFIRTSGLTWNHDLTMLFAIASLCLLAAGGRAQTAWPWLLASGVCGGWAVCCRLTLAPAALPMLCGVVWLAGNGRRCAHLAVFCAGALVALAPALWWASTCPDQFFFGNFEYPRLPLLDPDNTRIHKTMALWRKARFFFKEVLRSNWALAVAFFTAGLPGCWRALRKERAPLPTLLLMALPFVFAGCLAPSRYQFQHFYALAPLAVLCVMAARDQLARWQRNTVLLCAAFSLATAAADYRTIAALATPQAWFPMKAHVLAIQLRAHVRSGLVLTLAPAYPLEAGLRVHPGLVTGCFLWRNAHLLDPTRRRQLGALAPADLPAALAADPPVAVLTGVEDEKLEAPLVAYARAVGCETISLGKNRVLWLVPDRSE